MEVLAMKKKKTIFIIIAILIILLALLLIDYSFKTRYNNVEGTDSNSGDSTQAQNEINFPVTASIVRKGKLTTWIDANGYAYSNQKYEIRAKSSGQVVSLNVHDGESVEKGQQLLKLDDAEYQLDVNKAHDELIKEQIEFNLQMSSTYGGNIDLSKFKARFDSLKQEYNKSKILLNKGKITLEDFERTKRDFEALKTIISVKREDVIASMSGLSDAQSNYEKAQLDLSHTKLLAPISGIITDCKVSQGSYVNNSDLCMNVIDISRIKIKCGITESDIKKIHVGDTVKLIFIGLPGKQFYGSVSEINPDIDVEKRTANVTVLLSNPDFLIIPGMYASVKIGYNIVNDVIIIPHSALLIRENRTLVFTVKNGTALWKYVTLGSKNDDYYVVKKGLSVGDTLITGGNYNLAHLSKVTITKLDKY
jgi:membrane fusion protein, multidrug efflux system